MSADDQEPPRIPGTLDAPDVTPLERATVQKLRDRAGWWQGDANALRVLRTFAATVRAEAQPTSQPLSPT